MLTQFQYTNTQLQFSIIYVGILCLCTTNAIQCEYLRYLTNKVTHLMTNYQSTLNFETSYNNCVNFAKWSAIAVTLSLLATVSR